MGLQVESAARGSRPSALPRPMPAPSGAPALGIVILAAVVAAVVAGTWIVRAPVETMAVVGALGAFAAALMSPGSITVLAAFLLPISPEVPFFRISTELSVSQTGFSEVEAGLGVGDMLVLVGALGVLLKVLVSPSAARRLASPLTVPIVAFWAMAAFSLAVQAETLPWSALKICSMYLARGIEVYAVYFVCLATVRDERTWRRVFGAFVFSGLIALALGIHDTLTVEYDEDGRLVSGFRMLQFYRGEFGNYMLLLTGLLLWLAWKSRNEMSRWGLRAAALLAAVTVSFATKRAIVIAAVVMLGATIWLVGRRYRSGAMVALGVVLLATLFALPAAVDRFARTFEGGHEDISNITGQAMDMGVAMDIAMAIDELPLDSSTRHRFLRWLTALSAAWRSPLVGWGYYAASWQGFGFAHNQFLSALAEMGVIGLAALVWFLRRLLRTLAGYMTRFDRPGPRALALTLYPLTISLVVQSVFGDPFYYFKFMSIYWVAVGLLVTAGRIFPARPSLSR